MAGFENCLRVNPIFCRIYDINRKIIYESSKCHLSSKKIVKGTHNNWFQINGDIIKINDLKFSQISDKGDYNEQFIIELLETNHERKRQTNDTHEATQGSYKTSINDLMS